MKTIHYNHPLKAFILISLAVMLVAFLTSNVFGASPATSAKLKTVLGKEQKALVISHLRAFPEPRSVDAYNQYAEKQSEQTVVIANVD